MTPYLMYHELETPGRPLCRSEPGYVRYAIGEDVFCRHLTILREHNWRGSSVGAALGRNEPGRVVLTFDDGCATDLLTAAPLLRDASFAATFYLVAGFIDQPGFLSREQVRELAEMGMEVGCHSMTHAFLSDLDAAGLKREVVEAKDRLEQILGAPVVHYSCPGGRWSPAAAQLAKSAGFRSMATSRVGTNTAATDPFQLQRLAIMRSLSDETFTTWCQGRGLWRMQLSERLRAAAKGLLGNEFYERVRAKLLGP